MPQATRSKVTKRKLESSATEKENKALQTNQRAVERIKSLDDTKKESLLAHLNKDSLKVNLKALATKYDNLVIENMKNLEKIKKLTDKVNTLEKKALENKGKVKDKIESRTVPKKTSESQTEDPKFPCKECIFQGSSEEELKWHHNISHQDDRDAKFVCTICGNKFAFKWELMAHRKGHHPTTIKTCRYFLDGNCAFGEDNCWFSHTKDKNERGKIQIFKCNMCGDKFDTKKEFMLHRKVEHSERVSDCIHSKNGNCRFSGEECWYKHKKIESEIGNNPIEIIRLFDIMEKFAQRLEMMERQN